MALTAAQKTTLKTALLAETDPGVVTARTIGNAVFLADWCNSPSTQDAWKSAAQKQDLFEACNITQFDALTQGKRDAWWLMQDNVPIDFGRNKMRSAVVDMWGAANSVAVLQALVEKATRAENYLGGTSKTTNTVVALDRSFVGRLTHTEVSEALNS